MVFWAPRFEGLFFGRGGLWADQAHGFLGIYPLLRVLRLAVSPLRRVTFSRRRKGNRKGLLLRSALAGSGSFAAGSIRAQRLRFASLHLHSLCLAAPDGRCAPTPGSIPPLSLPTSPVNQDQKHSSLRSLLSGAAAPQAASLLCFSVGASLLAKASARSPSTTANTDSKAPATPPASPVWPGNPGPPHALAPRSPGVHPR